MHHDPKHIAYLLFQSLGEALSAAERTELDAWLAESPDNQALLAELQDEEAFAHRVAVQSPVAMQQLSERMLDRVLAERAVPSIPLYKRTWVRYAAAVLLLVGAATYYYVSRVPKQPDIVVTPPAEKPDLAPGGNKAILTLSNGRHIVLDSAANGLLADQDGARVTKLSDGRLSYQPGKRTVTTIAYNTMSTPKGGTYQLTLPDGTKVWLNAASSITYPTVFTGTERKVSITGELYFEVAKNAHKPFRVAVNDRASVEVLGTHFNINAYDDEPNTKVTLLEGSVKVNVPALSDQQSGIQNPGSKILAPGQQAVLNDASLSLSKDVDIETVMAWKEGYFRFNRTELRTVMRQLARWYDVDISYEGNVPNDTFIGKLPMSAPASQVLKALEEMQVHFRIEGKRIIVTP